jgi:ubiquinone/menaquinone biosynthesis C-methylase UbiE
MNELKKTIDIWKRYEQTLPEDKIDPELKKFFLRYEHAHFIVDIIPHNTKILDIGCGTGAFLAEVAKKRECEVYGIDILPDAIEIAKKKYKVNAIVGDANSLPYKDSEFDVVVSFGLFEHWDNPLKLLKEWTRVLKKNGIHICMVPNRYGFFGITLLQKKLYEMRNGEWKFGYERRYGVALLKRMFERCNYNVTRIMTSEITPPFWTNTGLAKYPKFMKMFTIKMYNKIEDFMTKLPFGYHLIIISKKL